MLTSLLPFILVASSLQLLPDVIQPPTLYSGEETVAISKYGYLHLGAFGLIPAMLVIVSRVLKARKLVERNFVSMTVAALVLAAFFLLVCAYGMIYQIVHYDIDIIKSFDVPGGVSILLSLIVAMLANAFPKLRPNNFLGLKNRYTLAETRIWTRVHFVAADVYSYTFFAFAIFVSALSIKLDFRFGWMYLIMWIAATIALMVWSRLYARSLYLKAHPPAPKQV